MRTKLVIVAAGLLLASTPAFAGDTPDSWDGLVHVSAKRMDAVYLAPGADFRGYTKLMVDPTQAAFKKDWLENMNDQRDLSRRVDAEKAQEILDAAKTQGGSA